MLSSQFAGFFRSLNSIEVCSRQHLIVGSCRLGLASMSFSFPPCNFIRRQISGQFCDRPPLIARLNNTTVFRLINLQLLETASVHNRSTSFFPWQITLVCIVFSWHWSFTKRLPIPGPQSDDCSKLLLAFEKIVQQEETDQLLLLEHFTAKKILDVVYIMLCCYLVLS